MRTISNPAGDAARLMDVLAAFGRRRSLRDPVAAACEELELTHPQIHALMWLKRDGALTMGELARRVSSEKTITGIIDRLMRRRLVQRDRDGVDRRVVHCRLTRSGEKIAEKLDDAMTASLQMLLGLLDPADREHLIRILVSLQQRIEKAAA